jgi:RimJ/RimL family protein N-acetyltransferase
VTWQLVLDQRERCGEWARARIPYVPSWGDWYQAIGLERDGELVAVVVFNLYSGADVAMHIAAVPGRRWMTRQFLRAAFRYPFIQLGCRRVSGFVPVTNLDAQRFDEHLGFRREGLMREALPNGEDVIVYGMLERESRWHR